MLARARSKPRRQPRGIPRTVVLLLALLGALAPQGGVRAADNTVTLTNTSYQPADLTIHVGDSVTWVLPSSLTTSMHTVTSNDGTSFNQTLSCGLLQCLGGSDDYSLTFLAPGRFPYHCNVVPGMTGVITVVSNTPPSPSPLPSPSASASPPASPSPTPSPSAPASPTPSPSGSASPPAPASPSSSALAAQPAPGGVSGPTIVVIVAAAVTLTCGIGLVVLRRAGGWS